MEEANKWFSKSLEDFETAKYNFNGEKLDAGLFFLQQSAEKSLKALYIKKFKSLFKTHDLVLLGKRLEAPFEIIDYCKKIAPAYSYTQYPDASTEEFDENEVNNYIKYCSEIISWVKKNL